jgi:hypothetical protein
MNQNESPLLRGDDAPNDFFTPLSPRNGTKKKFQRFAHAQ